MFISPPDEIIDYIGFENNEVILIKELRDNVLLEKYYAYKKMYDEARRKAAENDMKI